MDRALPRPLARPPLYLVVRVAAYAAIAAFVLERGILHPHLTADGATYWTELRNGTPYNFDWPELGFLYAPPLAQAMWPLTLLPLAAFMALWVALQTAAVTWMAGPVLTAVLVWTFYPLWANGLWAGNIYPLVGAALALTLRYPATWAFQFVMKVTPFVGVLWHLVRGEWRQLGLALAATAGICVVSFALWPAGWVEWITMLVNSYGNEPPAHWALLPIPLTVRLPLAAGIIALAAWRDWRYLLPVGAMLALPQVGWSATSLLLASVYLWRTSAPDDRRAVWPDSPSREILASAISAGEPVADAPDAR